MKFNVSPWNISGVIGSKLIPDVRKPKDGPIPVEESFGLHLPLQQQKGSKTGALGESLAGSESSSGTEDEAASDPPSPLDEQYEPSIAPNEDSLAPVASQSKPPVQEQAGIDESLPMVDAETSSSCKKHKSSHEVNRGQIHERDQLPAFEERPEKRQREEQRKHQEIQRVEYAHHDINDFEDWMHFTWIIMNISQMTLIQLRSSIKS